MYTLMKPPLHQNPRKMNLVDSVRMIIQKLPYMITPTFAIFQPLAIHFRVDYSDMEAE